MRFIVSYLKESEESVDGVISEHDVVVHHLNMYIYIRIYIHKVLYYVNMSHIRTCIYVHILQGSPQASLEQCCTTLAVKYYRVLHRPV